MNVYPYFPVSEGLSWWICFVVVANWTFECDHVVTWKSNPPLSPEICCFGYCLFVCFIVVGCLCAKNHPEL